MGGGGGSCIEKNKRNYQLCQISFGCKSPSLLLLSSLISKKRTFRKKKNKTITIIIVIIILDLNNNEVIKYCRLSLLGKYLNSFEDEKFKSILIFLYRVDNAKVVFITHWFTPSSSKPYSWKGSCSFILSQQHHDKMIRTQKSSKITLSNTVPFFINMCIYIYVYKT